MPDDKEYPDLPSYPRLPASKIEKWVTDALSRFPVLSGIERAPHWSARLVAIMSRMDYEPNPELLANADRLMMPDGIIELPGMTEIVQKHISQEFLDDLEATIELEQQDDKTEVLTLRDSNGQLVEGAVYVGESGQMSYVEHGDEPIDQDKDRGESWGSW